MEENTIDHTEDGGRARDAQDQREERYDCEPRMLPEHP